MLDKLFNPRTVAVVGATPKEGKVGNTILKNLLASGTGLLSIYAVNPRYDRIQGLKCYPSLSEIQGDIDLAVIAIPAEGVPNVLEQCAERGVENVVVISAGFKEVGREGAVLESELVKIAKEHKLNIVGPNCLGIINTHANLNATFGKTVPDKGSIAFLSQSGAFALAVIDWAKVEKVGFSKIVSLGNKAVLDECHFLEYLDKDPDTAVVAMYLEDVSEGSRFMRVVREVSRTKPVVVMKSGMTEAGAKAASSHTGSIAGSVEAYRAAFAQAGIVEATSIQELFDFSLTLSRIQRIKGGIAIVTNSGGPGVMAADAIEESGLELTAFERETMEKLHPLQLANSYNPIDVRGDATTDKFGTALSIVAEDGYVGAIIAILSPTAPIEFDKAGNYVMAINAKKPVIPVFMGGETVMSAVEELKKHGIANYFDPVRAVKSLKAVKDYEERQKRVFEPPPHFNVDTGQIREQLRHKLGFELLKAYGIPIPAYGKAETADEALDIADKIGYPVAMKILSPDIIHKTDVGCVKLNVNREAVKESFFEIMRRGEKLTTARRIEGVLVQQMVAGGKEVIIGMKRDRHFGPLLMFGLGGIYVEVFRDVSFRIAPLSMSDAKEMIKNVRAYQILHGVRGEPMSDIDSLVNVLLRFSQLCVEFPDILEADLNPIKVFEYGKGCYVVDFKMISTNSVF
ncbi:MAG: acetate--CoA ligase family protein [Methanophagales archaeon]|nr:acetate--CoA ligase family protein [Methanophagales archaeon]MCW7070594.1 acetate--CoA ligase family protein [Methanophagales archaeon]